MPFGMHMDTCRITRANNFPVDCCAFGLLKHLSPNFSTLSIADSTRNSKDESALYPLSLSNRKHLCLFHINKSKQCPDSLTRYFVINCQMVHMVPIWKTIFSYFKYCIYRFYILFGYQLSSVFLLYGRSTQFRGFFNILLSSNLIRMCFKYSVSLVSVEFKQITDNLLS